MIFAFLMSFLFVVMICAVLVFIFLVLVPAFKDQKVSFYRPMFAESEIRIKSAKIEQYEDKNDLKAVVLCSSKKNCGIKRINYDGPKSCALFLSLSDTEYECKFNCIGFGDCLNKCSRKAITIVNSTAVVNSLCNGCGRCIGSCPKNIIKLVPASTKKLTLCTASEEENNDCSHYRVESELDETEPSVFHFWRKLYRMVSRGGREEAGQ